MGPDELLSCFIYVIVKAEACDMPALLTLVEHFTLEEGQDKFEFISTNLSIKKSVKTKIISQSYEIIEPCLNSQL